MRMFVLTLLLLARLPAHEWVSAFSALDEQALVHDKDLVRLCMPALSAVVANSPAANSGLQVGDIIVGYDGLRIYGPSEVLMLRQCRPDQPPTVRITVLRGDAIITCETRTPAPGARLGIDYGAWNPELLPILDRIAPVGSRWKAFPDAALFALVRWSKSAKPDADHTWVQHVIDQFVALTDQRWKDAQAITVEPPSDPELTQLTRFYHRLATRNAAGEQDPDPASLGESAVWYTLNYPYPRLRLPDLGSFTHPDGIFMDGLVRMHADQAKAAASARETGNQLSAQPGEPLYALLVRKALIDPRHHGGWPFRYVSVVMDDQRPALIAELHAAASTPGPLGTWCGFCEAFPQFVADRSLPTMLETLDKTRAQSPLIAYLGTIVLDQTCTLYHMSDQGHALILALAHKPFQLTSTPSKLLDLLRSRDPTTNFQLMFCDDGIWLRITNLVYKALHGSSADSNHPAKTPHPGADDF